MSDYVFPTFPVNHGYACTESGNGTGAGPGLTRRELFAAMAMQGSIAAESQDYGFSGDSRHQQTAEDCVKFADALIAALDKKVTVSNG